MKKFIIVLLFVVGCGPLPDITTSHGADVFVERGVCMSRHAMELALDHFAREIELEDLTTKKEFIDAIHHVGLVITLVPEQLYWDGKYYNGTQNGMHVTVYFPGCFSASAMFHELGHYIRETVWNEWLPDMEHNDTYFWNIMDRSIPEKHSTNPYDCVPSYYCSE